MRILLVDDHPLIRKGIKETLAEEFSALEVQEASDGIEAYDLLASRLFDLAIVDLALPGKGGLELIKDALALRPGLRILVISVYPEREFAERAYRSGAKGYLAKTSLPRDFLEAVRRILNGRTYVSPEYAEVLLQTLDRQPRPARADELLSDRELSVLRLFAAGESLTAISHTLHLSVKTVSTYKSRVMEKLHVSTNAELIAYALRRGLR